MEPEELQRQAVAEFTEWVWELTPAELAAREPGFLLSCADFGVEAVCRPQADETLALAVRKHFCANVAFQELLVNRYGTRVPVWFTRHGRRFGRTVSTDLAEELMQELWVNLVTRGLRTYDPERSFGSFLFVVSRNLFVARVVRPASPLSLEDWDNADPGDTVEREAEFRELADRVTAALGNLPADLRRVMELTMEGRSPRQIAAALAVPIEVVYRHRFLARRALERALDE